MSYWMSKPRKRRGTRKAGSTLKVKALLKRLDNERATKVTASASGAAS